MGRKTGVAAKPVTIWCLLAGALPVETMKPGDNDPEELTTLRPMQFLLPVYGRRGDPRAGRSRFPWH